MILRKDDEVIGQGTFKSVGQAALDHLFVSNPDAEYARYCYKVFSWIELVRDSQPGSVNSYEYKIEYKGTTVMWSLRNK